MKERKLTAKQSIALNLAASFITYIVTFGINFFLSPYIVKTVGVEAYGFVNLANNFISYASLITIALNALAGRFVTIKIAQGDIEEAKKYYTSVFFGNLILSAVLLIVLSIIWIYLEKLINIPDNIFWDVKILFAALFINSIVCTICSVFGMATFVTNKLYLSSIRNIESSIIRAVVLLVLFALCPAKVFYLGITTLITGLYGIIFNIYYTKKLTPELKIQRKYFDFKAIIELVSSGVWNLINRLGQILTDGLDLLITNLFIDTTSMGVLSLAKTVPSIITGIVGSMVGSFSPNFTFLYAEGKIEELKRSLKQSMKIMGVICNLPIIVLIVCGERFFSLWQPTQDAKQLQILSILTIGCCIFSGGINCLYDIFTVVNKLKLNALIVVGCGLLNTAIVFVLLKTTSLGIYAVAGVSTIISIIRNLAFTAPYGAKCLNIKWYIFYPDIAKPVAFVIVSSIPGYFISKYMPTGTWMWLLLTAFLVVVISAMIGYFVIFNKDDRKYVNELLKSKFIKRG